MQGSPSVHSPLRGALQCSRGGQGQEGHRLQAEDQGPDSLRPRLKTHTNPVPQRAGSQCQGPREPAANTKSLQKKAGCRQGGSTERGLRRHSAAQLPCPSPGTKEVPGPPKSALKTPSSSGHPPSSSRPLNHSPAPASTHPAGHAAPQGHTVPILPEGVECFRPSWRTVTLFQVVVPIVGEFPSPTRPQGQEVGWLRRSTCLAVPRVS